MSTALAFELPVALEAHEPPEARGLARDEVRLMVATRSDGSIAHASFRDLPLFLDPGDLLVINTSATLPAAVPARRADGTALELHFATAAPHLPGGDWWVVELRSADGSTPFRGGCARERLPRPRLAALPRRRRRRAPRAPGRRPRAGGPVRDGRAAVAGAPDRRRAAARLP